MAKPIAISKSFVTDIGQLSYPYLISKQSAMGKNDKDKYKATLIFCSETETPILDLAWKNILDEVGWNEFPNPFFPCFDKIQDVQAERYGYPVGGRRIRAWNYRKPRLFSNEPSKSNPKMPMEMDYSADDEEQFSKLFYGGAYVRANLNLFAWKVRGSNGISAHIHAVQFMRHCEPHERFQPNDSAGFTI